MEMANTDSLDDAEKKIEAEMKELVGHQGRQEGAPAASPQSGGAMALDERAADKT
jgi:hypothetical protein